MSKLALILLLFFIGSACSPQPKEIEEEKETNEEAIRALGQILFFSPRLSKDITISCASCHAPNLAFTDGVAKSDGVEGKQAFRNAPTLFNLSESQAFMFDGDVRSLEEQALRPIHDVNEMGSSIQLILERFATDNAVQEQCKKAFGRPLDEKAITTSLAVYQKSLISVNSRYDIHQKDAKKHPLTEEELAGKQLFFSKFNCVSCHSLPHFTNGKPESNGIALTPQDQGRFRTTSKPEDIGKFKVPSLRNIALTGPYMHDGRFQTLEEVLKFYASKKEKHGHELVQNYSITPQEQKQLIAFLHTLTDTTFLAD